MAVRRAVVAKEDAEERGERAGLLSRAVAGVPELVGVQIGR
jgi:hypothetical protein